MLFKDRREAGCRLAEKLTAYKNKKDVLVLALPRGGVVIGYEIACLLNCPLDILIVRKLGFPGQPELAIGAVSETGGISLNRRIIEAYGVPEEYINGEIARQKEEIKRRVGSYRAGRNAPSLIGKNIILVDDGVATGATMKAAISTLREDDIARLVAALPVASVDAERDIRGMVDELVCLVVPPDFMAVGDYYRDFRQVEDEEVICLLKEGDRGCEGSMR